MGSLKSTNSLSVEPPMDLGHWDRAGGRIDHGRRRILCPETVGTCDLVSKCSPETGGQNKKQNITGKQYVSLVELNGKRGRPLGSSRRHKFTW